MFWWFTRRDGEFIRYESREVSNDKFELVIVMPDGSERVEHFTDSAALNQRQILLTSELEADGWSGPHGWNL